MVLVLRIEDDNRSYPLLPLPGEFYLDLGLFYLCLKFVVYSWFGLVVKLWAAGDYTKERGGDRYMRELFHTWYNHSCSNNNIPSSCIVLCSNCSATLGHIKPACMAITSTYRSNSVPLLELIREFGRVMRCREIISWFQRSYLILYKWVKIDCRRYYQ